MIKSGAEEFLKETKLDIEIAVQDACEYEEVPPTLMAQMTCIQLAHVFAPFISGLKHGAFAGENGEIELVFQSLLSDKRLDCKINSNGKVVTIVTINEAMDTEQCNVELKLTTIKYWIDLIEWVKNETV